LRAQKYIFLLVNQLHNFNLLFVMILVLLIKLKSIFKDVRSGLICEIKSYTENHRVMHRGTQRILNFQMYLSNRFGEIEYSFQETTTILYFLSVLLCVFSVKLCEIKKYTENHIGCTENFGGIIIPFIPFH